MKYLILAAILIASCKGENKVEKKVAEQYNVIKDKFIDSVITNEVPKIMVENWGKSKTCNYVFKEFRIEYNLLSNEYYDKFDSSFNLYDKRSKFILVEPWNTVVENRVSGATYQKIFDLPKNKK